MSNSKFYYKLKNINSKLKNIYKLYIYVNKKIYKKYIYKYV